MSPTVALPTRVTLHHKLNSSPTLGSPLASMFTVGGRGGAGFAEYVNHIYLGLLHVQEISCVYMECTTVTKVYL